MELDIQIMPIEGLIPPEQLQAWKDYNSTEIRLFSEIVFPAFDRYRESKSIDSTTFRDDLKTFFNQIPEEMSWRLRLIEQLQDWVDSSRIESPGAEPLYKYVETIIQEDLMAP